MFSQRSIKNQVFISGTGTTKSFIWERRFPLKKFTIEIAVLVLLATDPSVYLGVGFIINKGLTTALY